MENTLHRLAKDLANQSIADFFAQDVNRFDSLSLSAGGFLLDYSKQYLTQDVLNSLNDWAAQQGLFNKINAMFKGDKINHTEGRAVLHTVLRAPRDVQQAILGQELASEVAATDRRMAQLVEALHAGELTGFSGKVFTDVVAVGNGASYYGPKVCHEALKSYLQHK